MTTWNSQAVRMVELSAADAHLWLPGALDVYVAAMKYPRGTAQQRHPLWREHLYRPGWRGVATLAPAPEDIANDDPRLVRRDDNPIAPAPEILTGIAYGYPSGHSQWWNQQLRQGLARIGHTREQIAQITDDYFELTELHVHPQAQGHGTGQWLLTRLLDGVGSSKVLLSTPEVPGEENRAWRLYRRLGFVDVLRQFTFAGDPRRFAILGRGLPL